MKDSSGRRPLVSVGFMITVGFVYVIAVVAWCWWLESRGLPWDDTAFAAIFSGIIVPLIFYHTSRVMRGKLTDREVASLAAVKKYPTIAFIVLFEPFFAWIAFMMSVGGAIVYLSGKAGSAEAIVFLPLSFVWFPPFERSLGRAFLLHQTLTARGILSVLIFSTLIFFHFY